MYIVTGRRAISGMEFVDCTLSVEGLPSIAAHMRDLGFEPERVDEWNTAQIQRAPDGTFTLPQAWPHTSYPWPDAW